MNYLVQIKAFYDQLEINPLNSSEIALWFALMSINNKTAWSEKFTVASSVLCQKSGMKDTSKSSNFFKARNALTQAGFITWRSRKGNQAAEYTITKLYGDLSTYSVGNSVGNGVDNSVDSSVGNSVALNKLNKTKQTPSRHKRSKRVYDQDSDYLKLANYLFSWIKKNDANAKPPNLQNWADEIRKLVELDHRSKHNVALVIKWCQTDSFWSTNILSASKLRRQFHQLELKMKKAVPNSENSPEDQAAKAKADALSKQFRRELQGDPQI